MNYLRVLSISILTLVLTIVITQPAIAADVRGAIEKTKANRDVDVKKKNVKKYKKSTKYGLSWPDNKGESAGQTQTIRIVQPATINAIPKKGSVNGIKKTTKSDNVKVGRGDKKAVNTSKIKKGGKGNWTEVTKSSQNRNGIYMRIDPIKGKVTAKGHEK